MSMSTQKEKSASKQDCKGQNNKTHSFLHTHVHSCLTAFNLNIRKEWQSYRKRVTEKEDVFLMPCDCLQISSFPFHTEIGLRGWRPPVNKLSCPRLSDCLCSASLTLTLLDLTIKKQHWAMSAFGWEAAKAHIHLLTFQRLIMILCNTFFLYSRQLCTGVGSGVLHTRLIAWGVKLKSLLPWPLKIPQHYLQIWKQLQQIGSDQTCNSLLPT